MNTVVSSRKSLHRSDYCTLLLVGRKRGEMGEVEGAISTWSRLGGGDAMKCTDMQLKLQQGADRWAEGGH